MCACVCVCAWGRERKRNITFSFRASTFGHFYFGNPVANAQQPTGDRSTARCGLVTDGRMLRSFAAPLLLLLLLREGGRMNGNGIPEWRE